MASGGNCRCASLHSRGLQVAPEEYPEVHTMQEHPLYCPQHLSHIRYMSNSQYLAPRKTKGGQ